MASVSLESSRPGRTERIGGTSSFTCAMIVLMPLPRSNGTRPVSIS